jgi:hypothetical protein
MVRRSASPTSLADRGPRPADVMAASPNRFGPARRRRMVSLSSTAARMTTVDASPNFSRATRCSSARNTAAHSNSVCRRGRSRPLPALRPDDGVGYSRWASYPRSGGRPGRNSPRCPARIWQAGTQERAFSPGAPPRTDGRQRDAHHTPAANPALSVQGYRRGLHWRRAFSVKQENGGRADLIAQAAPNGQWSYVILDGGL